MTLTATLAKMLSVVAAVYDRRFCGSRRGKPAVIDRRYRSTLLVIAVLATPLLAQQPDIGSPPGRLVDIGGRRLHLHCTGSGSPTVLLEAGASSFAIDWSLVQPVVAGTNHVCSYDRAGHGWSDPGGFRDATVVADLHAALQAAGEKPPYIMVGASRGGLYVRLYQLEYPDEVAGIVFVDPSTEDGLFTVFQGKAVAIASLTADQLRSTIRPGPAAVPRRPPQTGSPFDRLPPDVYKTRIELDRRLIASVPEQVPYEIVAAAAEDERAMLSRLKDAASTKELPLGRLPLIVLSRGINPNLTAHAGLGRLSANSRSTVVAESGHEIHLFKPEAVVQAIQDVVEAVRTGTPLATRDTPR